LAQGLIFLIPFCSSSSDSICSMARLAVALLATLRAADAQDVFIPARQLRGSANASIAGPVETKNTSLPNLTSSLSAEAAWQSQTQSQSGWGGGWQSQTQSQSGGGGWQSQTQRQGGGGGWQSQTQQQAGGGGWQSQSQQQWNEASSLSAEAASTNVPVVTSAKNLTNLTSSLSAEAAWQTQSQSQGGWGGRQTQSQSQGGWGGHQSQTQTQWNEASSLSAEASSKGSASASTNAPEETLAKNLTNLTSSLSAEAAWQTQSQSQGGWGGRQTQSQSQGGWGGHQSQTQTQWR